LQRLVNVRVDEHLFARQYTIIMSTA
jgi:hypothetical protein